MPPEITTLLTQLADGDREAQDVLYRAVECELKTIARRLLAREKSGVTLQPTLLVDDAFVRLVRDNDLGPWESRRHYYRVAAKAMRQILVDHARRRTAAKRGGGERFDAVEPDEIPDSASHFKSWLDLNDALERFARIDPRAAQIVELHHFGGRTHFEVARILNVSERTVKSDWQSAKMWLRRELSK